jgi:hypothetical protein
VSAARTSARLLRVYPPAWRRRYGEELEGLIVEASDGGRVPWRTRLDVLAAGTRERVRAAGLEPGGSPAERVRASALLVLCAWALFVLGGIVVGKSSEHWQDAVPAGGSLASVAYAVLVAAACCGSALVLGGVAAAVPSFVRFLGRGGWRRVRRPLGRAALVAGALVAATAVLALWGGGLDSHQREGGDVAYAIAFVALALLVAATIASLTAAAVAIANQVEIPDRVLRAEAWLGAGTAIAMATISAATIVWWVALGNAAPWFFSGQSEARGGSALSPQLLVAVAIMVVGTLVGGRAARRALGALPALAIRPPSGADQV